LSGARIIVTGCTVTILASNYAELDVPRRQGFAWLENARDYAEKLSRERGWPVANGRNVKSHGQKPALGPRFPDGSVDASEAPR
jgi:hypothetical protein